MKTLLGVVGDTFSSVFGDFGDALGNLLMNTIGTILWGLCDIFFVILNLFEKIYKAFAGIKDGGVKVKGEIVEGDVVLYLFQSHLVLQIFISILILSWFLLIIFTIFAIVKNQYSDKPEPVSKIINSSFKALLMYLLVPVATVVCLIVGNIVLQAINEATSTKASGGASDVVFIAAAYNANKLRDDDLKDCITQLKLYYENNQIIRIEKEIEAATGINENNVESATREHMDIIADLVDEHFAAGTLNILGHQQWNFSQVTVYYDSFRMSYITIWVGGGFMIWALSKITWGLISRIFKMTLYFAISPAVMATFPIDNGKALSSWRGEMVKNGTMAITTVGVMNVLYSILPLFKDLDIYGGGIGGGIVKIFINIIAFSSAKDLIASISGWFGTGDALAEGVKAKGQYTAAKKKLTGMATKGVGMFAGIHGGIDAAKKQGNNLFMGAMQGLYKTSGLSKTQEEFQKAYQGGKKEGKEFYKKSKTEYFNGDEKEDEVAKWEAREMVSKQKKAIDAKVDKLIEAKNLELDGVTDPTKIEEINKKYDDAIKRTKANAEFVQALYETEHQMLENLKEANEKRSQNFANLENLKEGYDQDEILRKRFQKTANLGDLTEADWELIKSGDFSSGSLTDSEQARARAAFDSFASEISSNEQSLAIAKRNIEKLYKSGEDGEKYLKSVFGDSFTGTITNITSTMINNINRESTEVQEAFADEKRKLKELRDKEEAKYSETLSDAELKIIGNSKKS